jgi:hypothetical protein
MHVDGTRASLGRRVGNDENTIGANLDARNQKPLRHQRFVGVGLRHGSAPPLRTLVNLPLNCPKIEPGSDDMTVWWQMR